MPNFDYRIVRTLLISLALVASATTHATDNPATTQFHALLADQWEWQKKQFPEFATSVGDNRYNDHLTDLSAAAVAKRKAAQAQFLARLKKINPHQLSGQDSISYSVFATTREREAQINAVFGNLPFGASDNWLPVSPMFGPQFNLPQLVRETPFLTVHDYETYIQRLTALPVAFEQMIARMQQGIASGWMPPAAAMQQVSHQIEAHVVTDPTSSLLYKPFLKFPDNVSAADQRRLADAGRNAVATSVIPSFAKLNVFLRDKYLPASRKNLAASNLPGGAAYYQLMIAQNTTTSLTAKEIHEIGLREVARIDAEMESTISKSGFKGTRAEFIHFTNTDPRFLYTRSEDMLTAYRDIAKRADAELPRLFAELPRVPYGIRAMEAYEGDNAEHYSRGAPDGSRAGYFEANVLNLSRRSSPSMQALLLHEAVPGHHLQIARQQEIKDLPEFRRYGWFTAYGEGWALYAESLGTEMGFYTDPYSKFGQLEMEMHRACRLVVDTGMHAFGWQREQAIAYLEKNAGLTNSFATAEVDRYIVWPGQALGYKIGELRIKALRAKATAALGDRFDLRRFHNAVIDNGVLPLDVLEQQIDLWIAGEKTRFAIAN